MRKRPEQTERTKAELQEAFWRLYEQKPVDKITVGAVCDLAGYNRGTFYLHFANIYELLASIEEQLLDGTTACVERCMRKLAQDRGKLSCLAALADVIRFYEQNRRYIVLLLGPRGDASFIVRLKDRLKPLWREYVVQDSAGRPEAEIDLILEYTLSGSLFMISRWLQEPGTVSAATLGHLVYDAAIRDVPARISS
ncbi:MAG: TetR/AcrR family transcriptional regulator [Coriobacteriia bacterium]|nr:TetR/AcrR family transcriptional regulator [Coriobacteriia bacterium]